MFSIPHGVFPPGRGDLASPAERRRPPSPGHDRTNADGRTDGPILPESGFRDRDLRARLPRRRLSRRNRDCPEAPRFLDPSRCASAWRGDALPRAAAALALRLFDLSRKLTVDAGGLGPGASTTCASSITIVHEQPRLRVLVRRWVKRQAICTGSGGVAFADRNESPGAQMGVDLEDRLHARSRARPAPSRSTRRRRRIRSRPRHVEPLDPRGI